MRNPLALLSLLLALTGCTASLSSQKETARETSPSEAKESAYLDYDVTTSPKVIDYGFPMLFNDEILPYVDATDYENRPLIPGDSLRIEYQGDILIKETYPATADLSQAEIKGVEVYEARIFEFTVEDGKLWEQGKETIYDIPEVIYLNDWQGYGEGADVLEEGMTVYGINPAYFNSFNCIYFCAFAPRLYIA